MARAIPMDWQLVRVIEAVKSCPLVDVERLAADIDTDIDSAADLIAQATALLGVNVTFMPEIVLH